MTQTLNKKDFWIWLAGFVDGEGCIYISKSKSANNCGYQYSLRLEIAQSNKKLLDMIKDRICAGSNVWNKSREKYYIDYYGNSHHHNKAYGLKITANKALKVLEKIYPYLQIKRKQAKLGMMFQKTTRRKKFGRHKKAPKEYFDIQEIYLQKIKALKQL
jgi:hypothetical protein